MVAFSTLVMLSQRLGPDHFKPIKILNVMLQGNRMSSNGLIKSTTFRDPLPVATKTDIELTSIANTQIKPSVPPSSSLLPSPTKVGATSFATKLSTTSSNVKSSTPAASTKSSITTVTDAKSTGVSESSSIINVTKTKPTSSSPKTATRKPTSPSPIIATTKPTLPSSATATTKPTLPSSTTATTKPTLPSPITATTKAPSKFYVCSTFMGGLGNNLFQFASGFGIAASKDMQFVVGESDLISRIFQLKSSRHLLISRDRHECARARPRVEARACSYDKNVGNFKPDATYRVASYLQSWKYFQNASQELREQLKFKAQIQTKADSIIDGILKKYNVSRKNVTLIAIHVRRGDMVNHGFGYLVATKEYFEKAMELFSNYSSPIYILCSNDLAWSKANIPQTKTVEFISGNSAEVDMALMASCDHVISSVGSFSWWTGWLNNGTLTYYKWPAKEGSGLRAQFSSNFMDYFYPHWTGL
ncbi:galactoside alpha-(1,2)-fucosyltransferase 2-like isoform X2 [Ostrea edulis]|nr:galactoside alpha-(1,2)-fucosyltransferase 2-like isoform X2 [Ostrea edulis]